SQPGKKDAYEGIGVGNPGGAYKEEDKCNSREYRTLVIKCFPPVFVKDLGDPPDVKEDNAPEKNRDEKNTPPPEELGEDPPDEAAEGHPPVYRHHIDTASSSSRPRGVQISDDSNSCGVQHRAP